MTLVSNRVPDLKLPNTPDLEFGTALHTYLKQFGAKIHIKAGSGFERYNKEVYDWCESNMGSKYKDWFMIAQGVNRSNAVWIRDPKRATLFRLRWNEMIEDSLDNPVK